MRNNNLIFFNYIKYIKISFAGALYSKKFNKVYIATYILLLVYLIAHCTLNKKFHKLIKRGQ